MTDDPYRKIAKVSEVVNVGETEGGGMSKNDTEFSKLMAWVERELTDQRAMSLDLADAEARVAALNEQAKTTEERINELGTALRSALAAQPTRPPLDTSSLPGVWRELRDPNETLWHVDKCTLDGHKFWDTDHAGTVTGSHPGYRYVRQVTPPEPVKVEPIKPADIMVGAAFEDEDGGRVTVIVTGTLCGLRLGGRNGNQFDTIEGEWWDRESLAAYLNKRGYQPAEGE